MRRPYRSPGLSDRDREVIEIERRWGPGPSATPMKLDEAQERLGLDARSYTLVVNSLIDDPSAHAADPETMASLRQIRDAHRERHRPN
ncbi:DUF3263 domain-containing protein [Mobilicoccus pelagius]|uniref:DUF3263 domain-containing protein n=1 Tax=Mobilicoccus pelagius NBRC 104925 TaxID=1089455 RepID=H5UTI0_9MICO|nr:DUF3263 domain-containing protein [Mobilicoccus pelagius]GAB49038.1 hypothetical protein MOPEL_096_00450 [Mobilicoccus pelagius NBRC 104925]